MKVSFRVHALAGAALFASAAVTPAFAEPVQANSNAYNLSSSLVLLPLAPINVSAGDAPAPYDVQNTLANVDLSSLSPFINLSTGILNTRAQSNADGVDDGFDRYAQASSLVDGLGLDLLSNLLSLDVGAVSSHARVSGQPGGFVASGGSYLANVSLDTLLTMPLKIAVWDNFAPNTKVIDNLLGITLTFNEQIENCGADFCELTVNAINIGFNNVALGVGNLVGLNGNLIIGHSYAAAMAATPPVPEASSYAMMLAGLGLVGYAVRRRKSA